MTRAFEFARRAVRFRAPVILGLTMIFGACNATDKLTNPSDEPVDTPAPATVDDPSFSTSFRGGIPFGTFRLPTTQFGSRYNGAMRNIDPNLLVRELAAIRARGGKVVLMFAGPEWLYKVGGHFSYTKWKARIDRFKRVNFDQFIKDGTVIGHYLIDEPNDPHNWGGRPVPPAQLEEMAKYSKSLWPGMATVVRTYPEYLKKFPGRYRYLDAAWAQYVIFRWPNVQQFISTNVANAKAKGLGLIVGLNIIKGGSRRGQSMSATQVRNYGAVLLSSSYPCAFISWQYRDSYMRSGAVQDAMSTLRNKAQARSFKTCRGS